MGFQFIIIGLVCVTGLAIVAYGLVTPNKTPITGIIALLVALVAGLGADYSWTESQSLAWTAGYGFVTVVSRAGSRSFKPYPGELQSCRSHCT